jgi:hypothetical protein
VSRSDDGGGSPSLDALERRVRDGVVATDEPCGEDLGDLLTPLPGLSPAQQMAIYRDGWFSRLRGCLAEDFPGVERVLGHHGFDHLVADYLRAHPSSFPDITRVGHAMESFLASRADHGAFLVDLAALEWAITTVFDHPEVAVLRPEDVEGASPEALANTRFSMAASTRILRLRHPAARWLQGWNNGESPEVPTIESEVVTVSRAGSSLTWGPVSRTMVPVLDALADGATVEEAVLRAAEGVEDPEALQEMVEEVRSTFARWVSGGVFAAIE